MAEQHDSRKATAPTTVAIRNERRIIRLRNPREPARRDRADDFPERRRGQHCDTLVSACASCSASRNAPADAVPTVPPTSSSGICLLDRPSDELALVASEKRTMLRMIAGPTSRTPMPRANSNLRSPVRARAAQ